jgi:hypothetical protein
VIRRPQGEGVRQLVPERGAEVELAAGARGGGVHRDHGSEADAERAQPGKTNCPDGEIGMSAIQLDAHRCRRLVAVAHREGVVRDLGQLCQVWREQVGLIRRHDEQEAR